MILNQCFMQRPVHPSYGRVKHNLDGCLFVCGRVWTGKKKKKFFFFFFLKSLYPGLQYVGLLRMLYRALYTSCYCHII